MKQSAQLSIVVLGAAFVLFTAVPVHGQTLTEDEAIARALSDNPSLRAAVLDLQATERSVDAAEALRVPVLRAGLGGGYDDSLGATAFGVAPGIEGSTDVSVGIGWSSDVGTTLSFDVAGSWSSRDATRYSGEETNLDGDGNVFGAEARLRVTQPLLRGAGRDIGEASERAARFDRTATEHARDNEASALVRDAANAYWSLWYVQQAVEVNRQARTVAERQLSEARTRVNDLGTMARADALRYESELASIEEDLTQAESEVRTNAVTLGQLMGTQPAEARSFTAADEAPMRNVDLTDGEVLFLARTESPALRELEANLESVEDRIVVARDGTLPRLDLTASLAVGGGWNQWSDELGSTWDASPNYSGMVGLELELPFTNTRADAGLAEARIRLDAAEARLEARVLQVETEALNAWERLETARRRVALAQRSVEIARELADAEQARLDLGTSTAFQALEAQASLRRTELRYLSVLVDQASAALTVQHLTGQLLPEYAAFSGAL